MAVTWVKWPPYGADSVIVVVYGVWVPSAQSGTHPSTMEAGSPSPARGSTNHQSWMEADATEANVQIAAWRRRGLRGAADARTVRREDAGRGGLRSMSTAGRGGDRRAGPAHPRPGGLRVLAVSLRDPAFGTGRHRRRARQGRPPLPAPACAPSPATPTASPGMAFSPAGGCWPPAAWTRRCSCGPYPGRRAADQAWPNMRRGLEKPGRPGVRKGIPDRLPDTTGRPLRRGSRPGCDFRG